jgi:hypothetical protein
MKRIVSLTLVALLLAVSIMPAAAGTGNGAPSGPHYNLNIIGVPKDKNPDFSGGSGHRIFVDLQGQTKIMLEPSDPGVFEVTDANGTDGRAGFSLPVPSECAIDAVTCTVSYTVWIRAVGIPHGTADMATCAEDPDLASGYICSDPDWVVTLTREPGQNTFKNYSKQLLFLSTDVDADGIVEHVPLFDALFDQYYWQYDNTGLKVAQVRFYMGDFTIDWNQ